MVSKVESVEVYTTHEPCLAKTVEYRGLVMVNKTKTRNIASDFFSCFK